MLLFYFLFIYYCACHLTEYFLNKDDEQMSEKIKVQFKRLEMMKEQ